MTPRRNYLVNYFVRAKKREYLINLKVSLATARRSSEQNSLVICNPRQPLPQRCHNS